VAEENPDWGAKKATVNFRSLGDLFHKSKVVEQSRKVTVRREKSTPVNLPLLLARGRLSEQCGFPLRDGSVAAPGLDGQANPLNAAGFTFREDGTRAKGCHPDDNFRVADDPPEDTSLRPVAWRLGRALPISIGATRPPAPILPLLD
jgi:hypothetical protein